MTDALPTRLGDLMVSQSMVGDIRVIALSGELDHTVRDHMTKVLSPPTDAEPSRTVADFTRVTFMDSSGVNALIAAHRAVQDAQGWLRIAGPQPQVLRVIQLVGIDTVIACYPTLRQALAS
ncbi:STAS domain-containing protein [Streptomyces sp. NPDC088794]|uniref:STAS domain-containing protein n=1 Tax=Streptomyces sp. NPDC088794 TaxID=3365902 RepID=UPI0037F2EE2F